MTGAPRKPGTFAKGDARINRKGRPKSFDALRALAQQIAHEAALKNGEPLVIDGHIITVTEAILRTWAQSKDPRLQQAFIEVAFGKVPQRQELSGPDGGALLDSKSIDRSLSALAHAVGEIISRPGAAGDGVMGTTE